MNRLLFGSLALLLASAAFAAPDDPAKGTDTTSKHSGKHHKGKKTKSGGSHSKNGSAPKTEGQPASK